MPRCGTRVSRQQAPNDMAFTLVELVVAMLVMLVLLTAMLGFFISSLETVTLAKQRQTATALATRAMEQIRALPYDQVGKGVDSNDIVLSGVNKDPHLASATSFVPATGGLVETLQVTTPSTTPGPARGPLAPHVRTVTPEAGGQSYVVRSYVTQGTTTEPSFNLSVLVTWSSNVSNGPRTVVQRSVSYSPSGCLSTATHPFSGPCQAQFGAQAGSTPSAIQVGDVDAGALGGDVELTLAGMSTSMAVEQVSKMTSSVFTAAGKAGTSTSGGVSASAAADTDPSSTSSFTSAASTASQISATQSEAGSLGELRVTPTSGDAGSAGAMTAAAGTTCRRHTSTPIVTGQACASGNMSTAGTAGSLLLHLHGAAAQPDLTLATMSPGAQMRAAAWRVVAPDGALCPTGSGLGCALAGATRTTAPVTVGALPSGGTRPAGYTQGQFSVSTLTETLTTQAGVGQASPPASFARSGASVAYWNGTGYTSTALDALAADTSVSTPSLTVAYGSAGSLVTVEVQTDLTLGGATPAAQAANADAACKAAVCAVVGTVSSTVVATTTYTVSTAAGSTSFAVVTDLGSLATRSSWRAAPDA